MFNSIKDVVLVVYKITIQTRFQSLQLSHSTPYHKQLPILCTLKNIVNRITSSNPQTINICIYKLYINIDRLCHMVYSFIIHLMLAQSCISQLIENSAHSKYNLYKKTHITIRIIIKDKTRILEQVNGSAPMKSIM